MFSFGFEKKVQRSEHRATHEKWLTPIPSCQHEKFLCQSGVEYAHIQGLSVDHLGTCVRKGVCAP